MMLQAVLLAALLLQDPKPAARTVEDRLKELDEKLSSLEKKHQTLVLENAILEKKVVDGKAMREKVARQSGAFWVKRYAGPVDLSEKQSAEIEELWYAWSKEDQEKPLDVARWKAREEALRGKLTGDQVPRLARKVREDQEQNAKSSIAAIAQAAKLPAEKGDVLGKAVLPRLQYGEDILLPQAHPEKSITWGQILSIAETSLPDLSSGLTEEEIAALRKVFTQWKPKQR